MNIIFIRYLKYNHKPIKFILNSNNELDIKHTNNI